MPNITIELIAVRVSRIDLISGMIIENKVLSYGPSSNGPSNSRSIAGSVGPRALEMNDSAHLAKKDSYRYL